MRITILDTDRLYQEMLSLPDEKREAFFDAKFFEPFAPTFQMLGMPRNAEALGCLPLSGADQLAQEMLDQLRATNVWEEAAVTLRGAQEYLEQAGVATPETVLLGVFLGSPERLAMSEGYTGAGSIPGFIQIFIAPNEQNLAKLNACIAHEFHHNALMFNMRWNFMEISLSHYLAVEGLAESLAAALYGEQSVGLWVTGVTGPGLADSRRIIGQNLDVAGFMEVRRYIFGAHPMVPGSEELGIPYCGGYAVGYHATQAYLRKSGQSIAEATRAFIDGTDIIKLSGYFDSVGINPVCSG